MTKPGYSHYYRMGQEAFKRGIRCSVTCDPVFMDGFNHQWQGAMIGDDKCKSSNAAMDAWYAGWIAENLKWED